jgi:hypothetical protein
VTRRICVTRTTGRRRDSEDMRDSDDWPPP